MEKRETTLEAGTRLGLARHAMSRIALRAWADRWPGLTRVPFKGSLRYSAEPAVWDAIKRGYYHDTEQAAALRDREAHEEARTLAKLSQPWQPQPVDWGRRAAGRKPNYICGHCGGSVREQMGLDGVEWRCLLCSRLMLPPVAEKVEAGG